MVKNLSTGSIKSENMNYMNKLYEIMKDAVIYDSEQNRINFVYNNIKKNEIKSTNETKEKKNIFQSINISNPNIESVKTNKIFKIIKENNSSNKRSIQIIYLNNEENQEGFEKKQNNFEDYNYDINGIDDKSNYESNYYQDDLDNINDLEEGNLDEENRNECDENYFNSYQSLRYIFK